MATENAQFIALVGHLKHIEATFLPISMDWLCLQLAQMPRSRDLVIFVVTKRRTEPITLPLVHACQEWLAN